MNKESIFLKKLKLDPEKLNEELTGEEISDFGYFSQDLNGVNVMVVYSHIKAIDSYIFQMTSIDELAEKMNKSKNTILLVVFASIIILSVITYFITSLLLKKLRLIIKLMRRVQEGELFVNIPHMGRDEIGELAHHFQEMLNKINELIFTVVKKQSATKDAEIRALQTQINAHFLYNVLEAIKTQAELDYKYDVSDSITALGRLLRYSMDWKRKYVILRAEIDNIKNYMALMNLRLGDEITVRIDIDEELMNQEILKMTIQPIVENAINHGFDGLKRDCLLSVTGHVADNKIFIEVMDNGVGMNEENLESLRGRISGKVEGIQETGRTTGIGLHNVNERIKLFYGEEYGIEVISKLNEYTKIQVILPYRYNS